MEKVVKIPLILEPAKEGGWTVRSPIIPELITEIDHISELEDEVKDAVEAAKELYEDMRRPFRVEEIYDPLKPLWFETLIQA
ncbi:MAG: type II toxin-antitoxin system HicB family antitoxin [Candidatus Aminicenantes bacterium]|nr:type II toxin-antitoxin system HicB family antitoxin [Candidatus Aminicenantes bacterium]